MREPDAAGGLPQDQEPFAVAQALIESRQNISPRHLVEPGPSREQLDAMLTLAAAAPDHGQLTPWRFVLVPMEQRHRLAEVFALSLVAFFRAAGPSIGTSVLAWSFSNCTSFLFLFFSFLFSFFSPFSLP